MSEQTTELLNKIKGLEDRIASLEKKMLDKSPAIQYPPNLDNPDFREALTLFMDYREERKMKMTKVGLKRLLKKLSEHGSAIAIEAIHQAIDRGYRGVFPESVQPETSSNTGGGW